METSTMVEGILKHHLFSALPRQCSSWKQCRLCELFAPYAARCPHPVLPYFGFPRYMAGTASARGSLLQEGRKLIRRTLRYFKRLGNSVNHSNNSACFNRTGDLIILYMHQFFIYTSFDA